MFRWIPWFKKDPSGYLYYVLLDTSDGPLYKIGVTKKQSLRGRFREQLKENPKFIKEVFIFEWLDNVEEPEKILHSHFSRQRAYRRRKRNKPLYGCGQSELYRADILGLHEALYRPRVVDKEVPILRDDDAYEPVTGSRALENMVLWLIVVIGAASVWGLIVAVPLGVYLIYQGITENAIDPEKIVGWQTVSKTYPGLERPRHPDHVMALLNRIKKDGVTVLADSQEGSQ